MSLFLFITDFNGFFEIPTPRLINLTKISDPLFILTPPFIRHLKVFRHPCLFIIPNVFLLTFTEIEDFNTNIPVSKFQ